MTEQLPSQGELLGVSGSRELAHISAGEQDGALVVTITGEVDISNIDQIGEVIFAQPNTGEGLIVDLARVSYLDSTAVSLLHDLGSRLRQRSQQLVVVSPPDTPPRRVLELTALYVNSPLADELPTAIRLLRDNGLP